MSSSLGLSWGVDVFAAISLALGDTGYIIRTVEFRLFCYLGTKSLGRKNL